MPLETIGALANVATLLVVGASAVAAIVQLRHLRNTNELEAVLSLERDFHAPELQDALRYVQFELAARMEDPVYRAQLGRVGYIDPRQHPEMEVCNWFSKMGTIVKTGSCNVRRSWICSTGSSHTTGASSSRRSRCCGGAGETRSTITSNTSPSWRIVGKTNTQAARIRAEFHAVRCSIHGSRPTHPVTNAPHRDGDLRLHRIEGSTQRWERDLAAMEHAVRRHDALVREAIIRHGGAVFKTIGDAFCAAFSRPSDAVAAMLEAQRALAAEDFSALDGLRVRAAIHTGTADEREGDYFGPAVNRVARLLAIGHGGQVLVSGVTSALVGGDLPPRASLRDLGEHRLKDLTQPEHVYELSAPDLATDFPPLRSLNAETTNLPLELTSFVGREKEIAEIAALVGAHRLVTLVGSGGVGKTRTSLHVAANLLGSFSGGRLARRACAAGERRLYSGDGRASARHQAPGRRRPAWQSYRRARDEARPARLRQLRASHRACRAHHCGDFEHLP